MKASLLLLFVFTAFGANGSVNYDLAPLDAPYSDHRPPQDDSEFNKSLGRSDVTANIGWQTPVRSQGYRGTCSIFSAIALLESRMRIRYGFTTDLDLSEQYLEYLSVRGRTTDGSNSWTNFNNIAQYGIPNEQTLPYDTRDWSKDTSLGKTRCGYLDRESTNYKSCLVVQRDPQNLFRNDNELLNQNSSLFDPEFVRARTEAAAFKNQYMRFQSYQYQMSNVSQIKQFLEAGYALTMGIPIYYGAWNHGAGSSEGIETNTEYWHQGLVGHPEPGSVDYQKSPKKAAGHSIVIVGYDDNLEVEVSVKMADGNMKTFRYKGVYFFKNSWGTTSFGKDFQIEGSPYPGYGMITQKYAHQHGTFYHLPL